MWIVHLTQGSYFSGVLCTVSFGKKKKKKIQPLKIKIENHLFSNTYFIDVMRPKRLQYLLYKHLYSSGHFSLILNEKGEI